MRRRTTIRRGPRAQRRGRYPTAGVANGARIGCRRRGSPGRPTPERTSPTSDPRSIGNARSWIPASTLSTRATA
ncbi:hypothetical protein C6A85_10275, partial [Mycobacterium sp. ITM-2017-0098]